MSNANRKKLRITAAAAAGAIAVAGSTLATSWAGIAQAAPAQPAGAHMAGMPAGQTAYRFVTLDNANDLTFNQLLGINSQGVIAGYFGSGAQNHPNKGYLLFPPYGQGNYRNENFPGSVQTQVTGLNDKGVTVGFWSSMNNANMVNDNHGFYERNGRFHTADFPAGNPGNPPVDQLLGVNNGDVTVGFYTDANGNSHGYKYNINANRFSSVVDPNAPGCQPDRGGDQQRRGHRRVLHQPRQRQHRRVPQGRRPVHRPGRPGRLVHHGARRQRPRRGRRHLHHRQRQRRDDARLHLEAGRRLQHRR